MLRVLMFGWEFAPVYSGGLGVACAGLGGALTELGVEVTFVLPRLPRPLGGPVRVLAATRDLPTPERAGFETIRVDADVRPYEAPGVHRTIRRRAAETDDGRSLYGGDLLLEVDRYAGAAVRIATEVPHDVIHCHDWLTYPAGIRARAISGRPLVVHVHATEFDRSGGGGVNPAVYDVERAGFEAADRVITVSRFTRDKLLEHYGVPTEKIVPVHNGVDGASSPAACAPSSLGDKVVLFLGRLTVQKGPEWFLRAAERVLDVDPDVRFVIAGSGDMETWLVERTAEMGLADRVIFAGFLTGADVDRAFRMARVYVMPSVSEPFGIAPLEAMRLGTPVIVSRQSGVSEVVRNCMKVDFWDTDELADKILGVLRHPPLEAELRARGPLDARRLTWKRSARDVLDVYRSLESRNGA